MISRILYGMKIHIFFVLIIQLSILSCREGVNKSAQEDCGNYFDCRDITDLPKDLELQKLAIKFCDCVSEEISNTTNTAQYYESYYQLDSILTDVIIGDTHFCFYVDQLQAVIELADVYEVKQKIAADSNSCFKQLLQYLDSNDTKLSFSQFNDLFTLYLNGCKIERLELKIQRSVPFEKLSERLCFEVNINNHCRDVLVKNLKYVFTDESIFPELDAILTECSK